VTSQRARARIEAGLRDRRLNVRHNPDMINQVFGRFCTEEQKIPSNKFREALEELDICVDEEEAVGYLRSKGGDSCFVEAAEFQQAAGRQWAVEVWAKSLPLADMLADALPKCTGCHRLQAVSDLKEKEIIAIADGYREGFIQVLSEHVAMLKKAYYAMASYEKKSRISSAAKKFEVSTMSCGKIEDFHAGLQKRIGALSIGECKMQMNWVAGRGCLIVWLRQREKSIFGIAHVFAPHNFCLS
jgi:hypothetical protein